VHEKNIVERESLGVHFDTKPWWEKRRTRNDAEVGKERDLSRYKGGRRSGANRVNFTTKSRGGPFQNASQVQQSRG